MNLFVIRRFLVLSLLLSFSFAKAQSLMINEFMSDNNGSLLDEFNESSDWIEIINNSQSPIDLGAYYLSDDIENPKKWQFPNTILLPQESILVYASGRDEVTQNGEIHTNFAINSRGEYLAISTNETIVHFIQPKALNENESFAFIPDASNTGFVQTSPTPGSSNVTANNDYIQLSHIGGIYENSFSLSLTKGNPNHSIYYTIDGSLPTPNDFQYSSPLLLNETLYSTDSLFSHQLSPPEDEFKPDRVKRSIILKAAVFNSNNIRVSPVYSNSYFIHSLGANHNSLPIISLSLPEGSLVAQDTGIMVPGIHWNSSNPNWTGNYYQRGDNWERESYIEYYDPNKNISFKQTVGLRTHGGNSRRFRQKGFKVYARREYGQRRMNYPFFIGESVNTYKSLVIKPFASSWRQSGIENCLANQLVQGLNIDQLNNHPVVLYINGEYWGVYYLEERIDEHHFEEHEGIHPDSIDIIENWNGSVREGDNVNFLALYDFVENNNFSDAEKYEELSDWIDIDNFIDYQLFEIFISNYDWPANNMRLWRKREEGQQWRWIFFDGDGGFYDHSFNHVKHSLSEGNEGWPTNALSTLFLRKLLDNESFKEQFLARLEFLLDNDLHPDHTLEHFEAITTSIEEELLDQIEHHHFPENLNTWLGSLDEIKRFLAYRNCDLKKNINKEIEDYFDPESLECTLSEGQISNILVYPNPNNGAFKVDIEINEPGRVIVEMVSLIGKTTTLNDDYLTKGENTILVNTQAFSSGTYILRIYGSDTIVNRKVIITR